MEKNRIRSGSGSGKEKSVWMKRSSFFFPLHTRFNLVWCQDSTHYLFLSSFFQCRFAGLVVVVAVFFFCVWVCSCRGDSSWCWRRKDEIVKRKSGHMGSFFFIVPFFFFVCLFLLLFFSPSIYIYIYIIFIDIDRM